MPRWPPARAAYLFYLRRILPLVGQTVARNRQSAYNYLPASVLEFPDGEALAELMRGQGLKPVEWYPLSFGIATLYVGAKPKGRSGDEERDQEMGNRRQGDCGP